jgi:hypothetical protein
LVAHFHQEQVLLLQHLEVLLLLLLLLHLL